MNHKKNYLYGLRDGIPIALAYFAVSFSLGIACRNINMSAVQAAVMSFSNMTSAGEFAALAVMASSAPFGEMALTQLIINMRYFLMSCSLSQKMPRETPLLQRLLAGFTVTDEIFGISMANKKELVSMIVNAELDPFYMYGAFSLACPAWTLGTFLGVVMGNILPVQIVTALSVALFAMFIGIVLPPARDNLILALVIFFSMLASLIFDYLPVISEISPGTKIIILTVLISGFTAKFFPLNNREKQN